jgi:hypothetical protein
MVYEVLATLWEAPATDIQVARAVEDRLGVPCSRNVADHHLRILRTCGYVTPRNVDGSLRYALTESGSTLLAYYAESIEKMETQQHVSL